MSTSSNESKAAKWFDFVVKIGSMIYAVETNFCGNGDLKLNETARSYRMLPQETGTIEGSSFVWFIDGTGWKSARGDLRGTLEVIGHVYNIDDMKHSIMTALLV